MRTLLLLLIAAHSCFAQDAKIVEIPKAGWVHIYFESIAEATNATRLGNLQDQTLAPNEVEVRIWEGFGLTTLRGYIFKCRNDVWSAQLVTESFRHQKSTFKRRKVKRNGHWAELWRNLETKGFCEIADDSQIESKTMVFDGIGWVVEIGKHNFYRTYLVNNPEDRRSPGGDLFLELFPTISRSFGIGR